ncbi:hypothetical protein AOLI_G00210570 [Acnodon oligacanthus]
MYWRPVQDKDLGPPRLFFKGKEGKRMDGRMDEGWIASANLWVHVERGGCVLRAVLLSDYPSSWFYLCVPAGAPPSATAGLF